MTARVPLLRKVKPNGQASELSIEQALRDNNLLGAALGEVSSWSNWLTVLKAAFGQELTSSELTVFEQVAGERPVPKHRVRELWAIVGRRGGKSRIAAAVAVYIACFCKDRHCLAHGEVGHILVLAASRDQARVVFEYCLAFLEQSPILRQELLSVTASEIRLRGNLVIGVHSNSFRNVRGRTLIACIFDECSFWRSDDSANPDLETYRAVRPALITPHGTGMLVSISTPYRKTGLVYQKWHEHFAADDDAVLVVRGPSRQFNPLLTEQSVQQALKDDPEGARAEWEAEFRSDLQTFLDENLIAAAIDYSRPLELPPRSFKYQGFVDPSGGRHDAYTLCIGHKEGDGFVADVVRGVRPPFDPAEVTHSYAGLLQSYRIKQVVGDNYAADWVTATFKDAGIKFVRSEYSKSQLYLEALPLFTRGLIAIPDLPPLLKELRLLERQTHRSGKDTVDHGKRGSDDHSNSLCGCAAHCVKKGSYRSDLEWIHGGSSAQVKEGVMTFDTEWRRRQFAHYVASGGYTKPY
jgi:hypothetical protein